MQIIKGFYFLLLCWRFSIPTCLICPMPLKLGNRKENLLTYVVIVEAVPQRTSVCLNNG